MNLLQTKQEWVKILVSVFFFTLIYTSVYSQCGSLGIQNPSFEGTPGKIDCMPSVTPVLSPWKIDCYNNSVDLMPQSNCNPYVTSGPSNGTTYLGLASSSSWKEGVSEILSTPMIAGTTYSISIDLKSAVGYNSSIFGTQASIRFYGGFSHCDENQLLGQFDNPANTAWQTYTFTFVPTMNYTYFIIANVSNGGSLSNYVLLDNLTSSIVPPTAGTLSGNQNICVGSTTTFSSTQSGGTWTSGSTGIATVNSSTGVVTGVSAGTATITYTVLGTGGCPNATATRTVTVTAPPTAGTLSGTQNICLGNSTTFSSTQSGGTWGSGSTGIATVNSSTGVVTSVAVGTATITYTVVGSGGCGNATDTRTVTVTAPPTAGMLSGNQNICVGSTTTFSSTQSGGTWSSGNTGIATVNSSTGVITGVSAGTATITYTVLGTGGCPNATATRTVTVTAPPTVGTLSGTQNICLGNSTTFSSTQSGGTWSSGNTGIATVNSSTGVVTSVAVGTATITYTVVGSGGCGNATDTRTVTVTAPPTAGTLSGTQNICVGNTTTFTSTQGAGTWSTSNSSIATVVSAGIASATITGVSAGTATITYTVAGSGGCGNAIATRTVTVTAPPTAGTLSGTQNICVGNTTTFTSTQGAGTWSTSNSSIATVVSAGIASATITGVSAGTATITYTVAGSGGCGNATATRTVTVTAPPTAGTLSGTQNICVGNTTTFTSTQSGGTWSSGSTGIATVNSSTGVVTGVSVGTATITYTVSGSGGCGNATATRTVTVTAPPTAGMLSGTQNICVGSTTTFSSTLSGGTWSSGSTGIATVNSSTGVVTGVAAGTATITYTVAGSGGCGNATATRTVTVTASPTAGTLSGTQNICVGNTTTFTSTQGAGTWSTSNSSIATVVSAGIASATITGVSLGTATITYTVAGSGGCGNATATRTVIVGDTSAPTINACINDTSLYSSALLCGINVPDFTNDSQLNITDNCDDVSLGTIIVTQNPVAGTLLSVGTHTIWIYATDTQDNVDSCSFDLTIIDTIAPVITSCSNDTSVYADENCVFVLGDYTSSSSIIVTDNCSTLGNDLMVTQVPSPGSIITTDTTVWLIFSDAVGNEDSCSFLVTLMDSISPVITSCLSDTLVNTTGNCQYTIPDFTSSSNFNVTDNCSTQGVDMIITQFPTEGTIVTSNTTVWLYATDNFENMDSCSFLITLNDTISPIITSCVNDTTVQLSDNCNYTIPDFSSSSSFVATDNCATQGVDLIVTQNPSAGTVITASTTVWLYATDGNGNTDSCSFELTLVDNTAPVIAGCVSDQTIEVDKHCNAIVPDYTSNSELVYSDNCSAQGIDLIVTQIPAAGTVIEADTTIWLYVTDATGNKDSCSFIITLSGCDIIIYQSFSPNGNGQNEYFYVENIDALPNTSVIIYNRWGSEVFQSDDYQNDWNGKSQSKYNIAGDELPEGTYYYLLTLGGDQANPNYGKVYKGYVYLKR